MNLINYKGFNSKFQCRGFQFEVGKTYTTNGDIELCKNGFHSCKNPFDVWQFYPPTERFGLVECEGNIDDGVKTASRGIAIIKELSLIDFANEGVKFILNQVKDEKTQNEEKSAATNTGFQSTATNTGFQSTATNTGYNSAATNTGYNSAATNTGNYSAATVEGKNSVAIVTGYKSKAKGKLGCWLVLTERNDDYEIINGVYIKIDGEKVKEDRFYTLVNGVLTEIE